MGFNDHDLSGLNRTWRVFYGSRLDWQLGCPIADFFGGSILLPVFYLNFHWRCDFRGLDPNRTQLSSRAIEIILKSARPMNHTRANSSKSGLTRSDRSNWSSQLGRVNLGQPGSINPAFDQTRSSWGLSCWGCLRHHSGNYLKKRTKKKNRRKTGNSARVDYTCSYTTCSARGFEWGGLLAPGPRVNSASALGTVMARVVLLEVQNSSFYYLFC